MHLPRWQPWVWTRHLPGTTSESKPGAASLKRCWILAETLLAKIHGRKEGLNMVQWAWIMIFQAILSTEYGQNHVVPGGLIWVWYRFHVGVMMHVSWLTPKIWRRAGISCRVFNFPSAPCSMVWASSRSACLASPCHVYHWWNGNGVFENGGYMGILYQMAMLLRKIKLENHWMWVMSDRLFRQTQMQKVRGYRVASCRHTSISPSSRSRSSSISSSRAWPEFQRIVRIPKV